MKIWLLRRFVFKIVAKNIAYFWLFFSTSENKNAKALRVHSVIYWSSYFSLKYVSNAQSTFVFYLGGSNLNVSAVFLSTHTPLPVLAAILDFWRKRLLYRNFDINFTFLEYVHVKEVKCNQIKLFVSSFE